MQFTIAAPNQLGNTLRGLRKVRSLTQADVAKACGLNQKTVSALETSPQRCSVESLFRYLAAVGATVGLEQPDGDSRTTQGPAW